MFATCIRMLRLTRIDAHRSGGCVGARGGFMRDWPDVFAGALPYASFLDRHATPAQRGRWEAMHARFGLTSEQRALLGGFTRRMPVLCLAGAWCGDCINQCPAFDHFARAAT